MRMRGRLIGAGAAVIIATADVLVPMTGAAGSSLPAVRGLHATAVGGPGVKVSWRWPASPSVTRAVVRYAYGSRAPRTSSSGDAAGVVKRDHHSLTIYGLVPQSTYSIAVFARGHGLTSFAKTVSVRTVDAPTITSTSLPSGVVGSPYSATLTVSDSTSGHWALESGQLPDGLSLSGSHITGTPTTPGTSSFVVRYIDSHGAATYAGESITIVDSTPTPTPTPTPTQ
jgi:hypothetical protein